MMSEQLLNRVEMELSQLQAREIRLRKLFPSDVLKDNSLIAEKVKYYQYILLKYKDTKNTDELFILRVINKERIKLTRELYPNVIRQIFHKVIDLLVINKIKARNYTKELQKNSQYLKESLSKIGFKDAFSKVEPLMSTGQMKLTVPISRYINEKERMDQQLSFVKDVNGYYKFEGYNAVLHNESKPNESREHFFMADENAFTATESYNLLAGRALEKEGHWVQFDLNDKDAAGNYRLKEFHADYGYDLEKILSKLPLKELISKIQAEELLNGLKQGSLEPVTIHKSDAEHKFYIEANPHFKTVNFYDRNLKKINLTCAVEVKNSKEVNEKQNVIELQPGKDEKKAAMRMR